MQIEIDHINARGRRGSQELVLRELCMTVLAKEIVGVVGPSGAGKTTLLQVLLGFIPSEEGRVRVDHVTGAHRRPSFLLRVGYVPQVRSSPADFTPRNLIEFRGSLGGLAEHTARARARSLLDRHALLSVADRLMVDLLPEQFEAVHLLASVVHRPKVWLVDRPTPNPVLTALLAEARQLGRAAVLCTRDMSLAEAQCDRVLLLKDGGLLRCAGG